MTSEQRDLLQAAPMGAGEYVRGYINKADGAEGENVFSVSRQILVLKVDYWHTQRHTNLLLLSWRLFLQIHEQNVLLAIVNVQGSKFRRDANVYKAIKERYSNRAAEYVQDSEIETAINADSENHQVVIEDEFSPTNIINRYCRK